MNNSLKSANREVSIFIEGYFNEVKNTTDILAENQDIIDAKTNEQARAKALEIYKSIASANSNIAYIYSGYANGLLLINDYIPPDNFDPTIRPWYTIAMQAKPATSIGVPYQEAKTEEWLISQSKAFKDDQGNYIGVVAIDCSLEEIIRQLSERHFYESQRTYIMDQNGKIIVHPDKIYLGEYLPQIKENISQKHGKLRYTLENKKVWGYYNTLDTTEWHVISVVDRREIIQPMIWRIITYTLVAVGLALGLGMLQSQIFGRRFAHPLMDLGKRITDITQGKPKREARYSHSNQEIAAIAENIEHLAEDSLNRKANELRAILESTVEGILVVSRDRQVIYVNPQFYDMWGIPLDSLDSRDDHILTGFVLDQLAEPDKFLEKIQLLYDSDQEEKDTLYFKDGRIFERFSRPLFEGEVLVGRLWSFRDVTQQKNTEDKLRLMAITDELTGLWNRRYFMHVAQKEFERAKRYDQHLSLLMLDIDHFKRINDTLGHAAGDATLQYLGSLLNNMMRAMDTAGRLGGEEFGVLLPSTDLENAVILAERLRSEIQGNTLDYTGSRIQFTVSIGTASYLQGDQSLETILQRADTALYKAKFQGRNQVVSG
ncbi:diguanylate cyclase [Desulfonatronospira sp.]|uniref:sensor domain-containing diguanylate cyclase n=1 Tax=Desulfonatronospira sp. TaxID=1962951 RepID=UPI0025C006B6|nr:diguanylate cyclase [Desulfonatronospira sp.]